MKIKIALRGTDVAQIGKDAAQAGTDTAHAGTDVAQAGTPFHLRLKILLPLPPFYEKKSNDIFIYPACAQLGFL